MPACSEVRDSVIGSVAVAAIGPAIGAAEKAKDFLLETAAASKGALPREVFGVLSDAASGIDERARCAAVDVAVCLAAAADVSVVAESVYDPFVAKLSEMIRK